LRRVKTLIGTGGESRLVEKWYPATVGECEMRSPDGCQKWVKAVEDEDPEARVAKILRLLEEPTIYFARDPDWQQWYRALDQYTASHHPPTKRLVTWPTVT
jgi:hypothetical protein